ncbi:ArsR family transcriptional regulator [Salinadaptatus halalkaliphilus]|uniref:ArsR family transcriptional regulator n=1 Tax=Salinadaptatus halalkaliphilus TaxID=2419781 RepID=A0A4S3TPU7_9EURY|nr:ArsR family transcriptional regulator [Salinadaptatus halalkaliphilus]THE65225.1 ArsR family transcriptional regulator [Salinadaptatus halalkaliphilus]
MATPEERIVRLLSNGTNRTILQVLDSTPRALSVAELAERLRGRAETPWGTDAQLERIRLSLHHTHLPQLEDVGLLAYDRESTTVSTVAGRSADTEWGNLEVLDEFVSTVNDETTSAGGPVEILEGRDDIYEYGRNLADTATDELFLIYTSDELLDENCLPHAQRAVDRGVDLYAGAKSDETREFFSEQLQEATIWEPQLDWMNRRTSYPTISRLIVADRQQVVVGLWDESTDGTKREVAMVGDGRTNPLVVLVRELLGPRLDHLDYQSERFLDDLPFEP